MDEWKRIKAEYIAGGTSYRKLAEKYGVSPTTLTKVAGREGWVEARQQAETKKTAKMIEAVSSKEAKRAVDITVVADKLLEKVASMIDNLETPTQIKEISTAIKNIKDIKGFKSDADMREQEARIRNLEKQCEAEQTNEIRVTISSDAEEFSS